MNEESNGKEVIKGKSVKKNYVYNLIYQLFLLIVPIAVTPYVARILGDDGSGKYSFCFSILTYFTLFAALGFATYGQRELAKLKDKVEQSKTFWEIMIARLIPVLVTLLVYWVLIFCGVYSESYKTLMIILSINVFAILLDVSFIYQANEEFGKMVFSNIIVKAVGIACIFVFVKAKDDLWKYALIRSLVVILSSAVLWRNIPKFTVKIHLKELKPMRHMLPTLILFLPTIATSIYTSLDKTLIGIIVPGTIEQTLADGTVVIKSIADIENGNYEYAEKIVKLSMTVITALGVVMIPKNTKLYNNGDEEGLKENVTASMRFVLFLGIPICLGCIAIARNLMPWYLGGEYTKSGPLMMLLSPLVLIIGFSNVFGLQLLIPTNQDKKYTIAIVSGAVCNLALNIVLIYFFKSYGAAIATICAELLVTVLMAVFGKKYIHFSKIVSGSWKYFVSGILMFVPCVMLCEYLESTIYNTFLIVAVGIIVYFVALLLLRDSFVLNNIKKIKKKISKK